MDLRRYRPLAGFMSPPSTLTHLESRSPSAFYDALICLLGYPSAMHFPILPLSPFPQAYLYQTNREAKKNHSHYVKSAGTRHHPDPPQPFIFPFHLVWVRQPFQLGLTWIRQINRKNDFPLSWAH
jgi:hypothetical protein